MQYLNKAISCEVPVLLHDEAEKSRLSSYFIACRPTLNVPPGINNISAHASKIPTVASLEALGFCPKVLESCKVIWVFNKALVKVIPIRVR